MAREPHRYDPPLRGRLGLLPLDVAHRPTAEELAFDKVGLRLKATMRPRTAAPSREVFDHYRDLMSRRAQDCPGQWSMPLADRAVFRTHLLRPFGTITNTAMWVRWEDDVHTMNIWLNVNPTRTLRHLLEAYPDESFLGATLESLPLEQFFGVSAAARHPPTLDGNDNAFDDLRTVRASMGENHAAAFLATFERQVRRWVCEVAAPHDVGFREAESGPTTILHSDHLEVEVPWWQVAIRDVEVYFERWRPNAPTLMNRISKHDPGGGPAPQTIVAHCLRRRSVRTVCPQGKQPVWQAQCAKPQRHHGRLHDPHGRHSMRSGDGPTRPGARGILNIVMEPGKRTSLSVA